MLSDLILREKIIGVGAVLVEKGLVQSTGGNISVRTERGFVITPTSMEYSSLVPDDMVELSLDGTIIKGSRTPSIERDMHRLIYLSRPDVNSVIHTHSICVTAMAAARCPLPAITDNQVMFFGGKVNVADYAPVGSLQLAQNALAAIGDGNGVILANHGSICTGKTLNEALVRCEMLETFANIFLLSHSAGGGVPLTDEEVKHDIDVVTKLYGQKS